MKKEPNRILVFDRDGYLECDESFSNNQGIVVLKREGGRIIKYSSMTEARGRHFLVEFKE